MSLLDPEPGCRHRLRPVAGAVALAIATLFAGCGGGDSFESAIRAVKERPCQRGGPLYVDIASSDSSKWRIKSLGHPGKEAGLDEVDWRTSGFNVQQTLAGARAYSGVDTLNWASAAVSIVPGCTASRILALERSQ